METLLAKIVVKLAGPGLDNVQTGHFIYSRVSGLIFPQATLAFLEGPEKAFFVTER